MAVWRQIAHHLFPRIAIDWIEREGRIALGWGDIGILTQYRSPAQIAEAVRGVYPGIANSGEAGRCSWSFCNTMRLRDLDIISDGRKRHLVVEITGAYEWRPDPRDQPQENHPHQRRVRIRRDIDPDGLWSASGGRPVPGDNIRWALVMLEP